MGINYNPNEDKDMLDIYTEEGNHLGIANRKKVHDEGLWHYAMHCWLYTQIGDEWFVVFQKRQIDKRIFPGKYDVAAAGHYIAGEHLNDGLRELIEELNISPNDTETKFFDCRKFSYADTNIINNEFWNIYLCNFKFKDYEINFDKVELLDVVFLPLKQALKLFQRYVPYIMGYSVFYKKQIKIVLDEFVSPYIDYFKEMIEQIILIGEQ